MKLLLVGKRGSGKDAAGYFLKKQYGGITISFAQPLYDMMYYCQDILCIRHFKDRKFLTTLGDFFRAKNPNIFINVALDKAHALNKAHNNVIITDGRYVNELDNAKNDGFYIIHIITDENIRKSRRPHDEEGSDFHSSENGYPDDYGFDFTITNNGTLEEFYKQLEEIVSTIIYEGVHVIY